VSGNSGNVNLLEPSGPVQTYIRKEFFQVRIHLELPVHTAKTLGLHRRELLEELGNYQCLKHGTVYIKGFSAGN
jgi:hypothetical protein